MGLTYLLTYLLMELSTSGEAANCAATQECPSVCIMGLAAIF
jgi:hypothetical protein